MDPVKVSQLCQILEERGIRPNKALSQNFLIDQNIVDKILSAAAINKNDLVLEIGPGAGALTRSLLQIGAKVTAVEKDQNLARLLQDILPPSDNFHLITGDFLKQAKLPLTLPFKVLSNVPYNITTPIIEKLTTIKTQITEIVLMVQKEMALRMLATPPSKENSAFSIFIHYHYQASYLFDIPDTCFYPKPKVISSLVKLIPRSTSPLSKDHETAFFVFISLAFQKRRKMLRGIFPNLPIDRALNDSALSPTARPQELSAEEFIRLFQLLYSGSNTKFHI